MGPEYYELKPIHDGDTHERNDEDEGAFHEVQLESHHHPRRVVEVRLTPCLPVLPADVRVSLHPHIMLYMYL
jgi:hypothetical protein